MQTHLDGWKPLHAILPTELFVGILITVYSSHSHHALHHGLNLFSTTSLQHNGMVPCRSIRTFGVSAARKLAHLEVVGHFGVRWGKLLTVSTPRSIELHHSGKTALKYHCLEILFIDAQNRA